MLCGKLEEIGKLDEPEQRWLMSVLSAAAGVPDGQRRAWFRLTFGLLQKNIQVGGTEA
jgi:hypothetical protein